MSKTYSKVPSDHFSQTNLKQILFTYMLINPNGPELLESIKLGGGPNGQPPLNLLTITI